MNTRLNKKVKKDLDAYFKGYSGSDPEVHHSLAFILKGALTDANFHSEAKKVFDIFPKAKKSKRFGNKSWEDSLEQNHGEPIAKSAKWDGHDIIDAIAFFASMFIGGPVGAKVTSLKEGMNENLRMFVSRFINEVTHSHEYEDMSSMGEDENDKEEINIGNYKTKYFHICPTASTLYGDMESKGVDMDMAERSARLLDALFFIEEHIQRGGYKPETDYIMVANNIAKNIMKMGKMMGLEQEHSFVQGHVDTIVKVVGERKQSQLEERVIELTEKNVPTDKAKWAASKAAAKQKFDVYPSAYANAWAAKNYKGKGGGWKTESVVNEAKSMDTTKRLKVYDKLKKGDEITIKYGSSMSSGREGKFKVTKGKTLVGKQKIGITRVERIILQNVKNPKGVKFYLYQRNGNVTMAIGDMAATIEDMHESVNEGLSVTDERHFGKKGIIIMIDDNGKKVSAIFKNKKNADKYNRNKSSDLQALLKLAKNTPYPKAIDESVNEGLKHNDMYTMLDIAAGYSSTQDQAASQMWSDEQDLYDYLKSDHIPKKYHKKFYKDIQRRFKGVKESVVNEAKEPEVITQLRKIVKDSQNDLIKDTKSGKKVRVDMGSANLIVQVYDALKKQSNKDKFVKSGIAMMGHTAYKLMKKEDVSESGIMYKAGVKKYGKEGMTKIQSAAGKGEGHEEIGKIKDKYDKTKNESVKPLKTSASFSEVIQEAEYQGRKVELNKPMQGDTKKFKVYVKNDKGNVVKVSFGQKGMVIKKDNPGARKSFRARMNCDTPGPKWKARYWSCRKW